MKKMIVNCATCDMRSVSEETLQNYEQIMVNAATVLVTPRAKELVNRYNVVLNAADVLEVPEGENVRVNQQNGTYQLHGDQAPQAGEMVILMVNGSLTIGEDALEAARKQAADQATAEARLRGAEGSLTCDVEEECSMYTAIGVFDSVREWTITARIE